MSCIQTCINLYTVLVRVTIAVMKHHDGEAGQRGKGLVSSTSTSVFITEGKQDRNSSKVGTWSEEIM